MIILVTGGAGFVGANFVQQYCGSHPHDQIVILDSLTYAANLNFLSALPSNASLMEGDICNKQDVIAASNGADIIVNFAAESHNDRSLIDPGKFYQTNVFGVLNLVQVALELGIRFHQVSTDEVFGDLPIDGQQKFNLESPFNPSSPYSASKASADLLVRAWVRSFGLKATISNCTNNFGKYQDGEKFIPRTIMLALSGRRPVLYGNGANVRDWISVEDHCSAIDLIIQKGRIGHTYLIGTDNERSNLQVVKTILSYLHLPDDFYQLVDDRPGHDRRYALDARATWSELGWQPQMGNFEQQLPATVDHYRDNEGDYAFDTGQGLSTGSSRSKFSQNKVQ